MVTNKRNLFVSLLLLSISGTALGIQFESVPGPDIPMRVPPGFFILQWNLLGPFSVPVGDENSVPTDEIMPDPINPATLEFTWKTVSAEKGEASIDLGRIFGESPYSYVYTAAWVFSEKEHDNTLLLGSDDGIVAWLNGEQVFRTDKLRGLILDEDRVPVRLREGANLLLLRVSQALRGWGFGLRFESNQGLSAGLEQDRATATPLLSLERFLTRIPEFRIRPYIQNVTPGSATILWKTDIPTKGVLTVTAPNGRQHRHIIQESRRLQEVRITGLEPDARYDYSVSIAPTAGMPPGHGMDARASFKTFPDRPRPLTFVAYGDTRTQAQVHSRVVNRIMEDVGNRADFVLHTGDLIGDGRDIEQWVPEYFNPAAPLSASIPIFPVLGNHENDSPLYFQYFSLPGNERWYSFTVAGVHIIALDSNVDMSKGSDQYQWLVNDLNTNRDAQWTVVAFHHQPFSSSGHAALAEDGLPKEKPARQGRQYLHPLFLEMGVHLVFCGHDHCYERSTQSGVVYVTAGGGGAPLYGMSHPDSNPNREVFVREYHYCEVNADADSLRMIARNVDGKVIDEVTLTK